MKKIPRSPFATRLSGSAREIELRIRSIFQWKKQRPPLALFLLMLAIGLLCGNLVSCQSSPAGVPEDPRPERRGVERPGRPGRPVSGRRRLHPLPKFHPKRAAGHPGHR